MIGGVLEPTHKDFDKVHTLCLDIALKIIDVIMMEYERSGLENYAATLGPSALSIAVIKTIFRSNSWGVCSRKCPRIKR